MKGFGLRRLYDWGRDNLPISWRRAIRRRLPVERWFGIRKTRPEVRTVHPSRREEIPGRPDMVVLPGIEWEFRRQRPQQLARAVAEAGGRVFYGDFGVEEARTVEPGVVLFPISGARREDLHDRPLGGPRLESAMESLRAIASRFGLRCAAVLAQAPYWGPLAVRAGRELGWKVVYDAMDEHRAFSTTRAGFVEREETELAKSADLVLASSSALYAKMSRLAAGRTYLLRNAGDAGFFRGSSVPGPAGNPRIGYYGAVAEWFDEDLVAELAARRPDWSFEIIGSARPAAVRRLEGLPNVRMLGERPYEALPAAIRSWNAAIIPFRLDDLTRATDPVKIYEMLAAGLPVVSTPLPELERLAEKDLVFLADGAAAFERALETALAEDDPARRAVRIAFAEANTWRDRAAELLPELRRLFPLASVVVVTFDNLDWNRACLASIIERTDWPNVEVIVVDNGSSDGTAKWLAEETRARPTLVRAVFNPDNRGFAPAVNQGLREAAGEFFCVLNNDTVVTRGWLAALIAHLEADPAIGLIGPSTNEIANAARITVGYFDLDGLPDWAREHAGRHRGETIEIPVLAMFCAVFRRSLYETVGPLDERFAVGMFEDDDYSRRVRAAGLAVRCARDSFVHHRGRASFEALGEERYLEIYRENRTRYREKWNEDPVPPSRPNPLPDPLRDREGAIVFLPSIGWSVTLVQRPHHLARAFARAGRPVVFDCSNGPAKDRFGGFREVEPNLFLYDGPEETLYGLRRPVLWAFAYNVPDLSQWPAGARLAYDAIDELEVFPGSQRRLERLQDRALREAAAVFAVSKPLLKEIRAVRSDAMYLPNAVDARAYARVPPPGGAPGRRPVAGYVGALARWLDYDLLAAVARANGDWDFRFVGEALDASWESSGLGSLANAQWLGSRPYPKMPAVLSAFDVGIIPFRRGAVGRSVSPLKLYEYFAAGRPVVATPIPEVEAFGDLVVIAADPEHWGNALAEARRRGADPEFREKLRRVARDNDWSARADAALPHLV